MSGRCCVLTFCLLSRRCRVLFFGIIASVVSALLHPVAVVFTVSRCCFTYCLSAVYLWSWRCCVCCLGAVASVVSWGSCLLYPGAVASIIPLLVSRCGCGCCLGAVVFLAFWGRRVCCALALIHPCCVGASWHCRLVRLLLGWVCPCHVSASWGGCYCCRGLC